MRIKFVHYSALLNLGNYSNEKIGFTAEFQEGDDVDSIVESLRQKVKETGGLNADEFYSKQNKARRQLADLEQKIKQATQKWDATAEFLRTQGIKPDLTNMPQFNNLLPEIKEEDSGIVEGEIEEGEVDDIPFEEREF